MRSYRFENETCYLTIDSKTHGTHEFIVDRDDYNRIKMFNWNLFVIKGRAYCKASIRREGAIFLHRLITSFEFDIVDHVNNNSKDNRKCNLRNATHSQNMRNSKAQKNNKTGVKGVRWREKSKGYEATITVNNKQIYLGRYKKLEEAAEAYRKAAIEYHGEFANHNGDAA